MAPSAPKATKKALNPRKTPKLQETPSGSRTAAVYAATIPRRRRRRRSRHARSGGTTAKPKPKQDAATPATPASGRGSSSNSASDKNITATALLVLRFTTRLFNPADFLPVKAVEPGQPRLWTLHLASPDPSGNPIPYTQNPKPYTQNPKPYTLNPKPYTLNPKP